MQRTLRLVGLLGALAVALGAFGAHGLKSLLTPEALATYETGVRYQFYHTFAIGLLVALKGKSWLNNKRLRQSALCFVLGIVLFSGSLYLLALREVHGLAVGFLGPITPVGGVFFIAGWALLFLAPRSEPKENLLT